jgi:hypothetical protein
MQAGVLDLVPVADGAVPDDDLTGRFFRDGRPVDW